MPKPKEEEGKTSQEQGTEEKGSSQQEARSQSLKDELNALLGDFPDEEESGESVKKDVDEETGEVKDEKTSEESGEEESEEETSEEAEETETEDAVDEEEEEEEDEGADHFRKQIDSMAKEIRDLKAELGKKSGQDLSREQKAEESEESDEKDAKVEVSDFIESDEQLDKIVTDREAMNEFLSNLVDKVRNQTEQDILSKLPEITQEYVSNTVNARDVVRDFYEANPDLRQHSDYVQVVANEVDAKEPGLSLEEVLEKTATEVRSRLKLSGKARDLENRRQKETKGESEEDDNDNPGFAGSKGKGRGGSNSEMNSEQEDVLELVS